MALFSNHSAMLLFDFMPIEQSKCCQQSCRDRNNSQDHIFQAIVQNTYACTIILQCHAKAILCNKNKLI